jgi:hypothetical protein
MRPLIALFLAGWFDRQELRLGYMEKYDRALNYERKTLKIEVRFNP